jgi:hypothetical protein
MHNQCKREEILNILYVVEMCKSDPIRSDFGTKIFISDRIDKVDS